MGVVQIVIISSTARSLYIQQLHCLRTSAAWPILTFASMLILMAPLGLVWRIHIDLCGGDTISPVVSTFPFKLTYGSPTLWSVHDGMRMHLCVVRTPAQIIFVHARNLKSWYANGSSWLCLRLVVHIILSHVSRSRYDGLLISGICQ